VAGPTISTEAHILLKASAKETFQPFTAFSVEHGNLRILHRVPRKPSPSYVSLDLFDHVALTLEPGNAGIWFVKEARLLTRQTGIGYRYFRLQHASAFTSLIARNSVPEESREVVDRLITTALAAFGSADRPDIVGFKSFYCFARDEGYPLKQQWFPTLPRQDRTNVITLLNRPLSEQTLDRDGVARLHTRMEEYLKGHTDILVD